MKLALKILAGFIALALTNCSGGNQGNPNPVVSGVDAQTAAAVSGQVAVANATCPGSIAPVLAAVVSSAQASGANPANALISSLPSILGQLTQNSGTTGTTGSTGSGSCNNALSNIISELSTAMVASPTATSTSLVNASGQNIISALDSPYGTAVITGLASSIGSSVSTQLSAMGLSAAQIASVQATITAQTPSILASLGISTSAVNSLTSLTTGLTGTNSLATTAPITTINAATTGLTGTTTALTGTTGTVGTINLATSSPTSTATSLPTITLKQQDPMSQIVDLNGMNIPVNRSSQPPVDDSTDYLTATTPKPVVTSSSVPNYGYGISRH